VIPKSVNASRIAANWNIWDFSLGAEDMAALGAMHRANGRYVALTRDEKHPHFPFNAEF
jgi:diketogulonate reductase-like aldo/keto reductase